MLIFENNRLHDVQYMIISNAKHYLLEGNV